MLVLAGVFLYYETRGTTLWTDEWDWALGRRGDSIGTFLRPHNSHLSLVPIAIYKLLFAAVGIGDYRPYRAIVIVAHLACVLLLFVYARRRVGPFLALIAAALILFLGPAWQNIIWPFQMAWLISLATGVGALLCLDRRARISDIGACVLLLVSIASSSIGVAIAIGAAVEVVWSRRRPADSWIVGLPLILYAAWTLVYQDATLTRHNLVLVLGFSASAAAGAMSALTGLAGDTDGNAVGTLLIFGAPLALAALAVLVWRLVRARRPPVRLIALLTMLAAFWILAGAARADLTHGYDSRYLYVSGFLIVLVTVELARGIGIGAGTGIIVACATAAVVFSNLGYFRDEARMLRSQAQLASADLGALDIVQGIVRPNYVAEHFPAWPLVIVRAGPYYAAERALGTPAASPSRLLTEPEPARLAADAELITAHRITLAPVTSKPALGSAPGVDGETGGTVRSSTSCATFRGAFASAVAPDEIGVTVPSQGLLVTAAGAPVSVSIRRFASAAQPLGTLPPERPSTLRISPDRSSAPWHLELESAGRVTICGLA